MRRILFLVVPLCVTLLAQGAWYWPFGSKEDDPLQPLRLHRLLEEANNYIEIAEDEAMKGNGDKALENYRLALGELDRVERENPDRAETAEFSPLRNKRAACVAAMDAIRFAQVNDNERAVSVTDTRELQKKWNKKHGIKEVKDEEVKVKGEGEGEKVKDEEVKAKGEGEKVKDEGVTVKDEGRKAKGEEEKKPEVVKDLKDAKDMKAVKAPDAPKDEVSDFKYRLKTALAEVRNRDYVAADLLLEELMKEKPKDLNVLLLRAAAQTGMGSNYAAYRTLEKAMRTHPKSYLPYYNLANLVLQMGEGVEVARQYYEMGRMVGGPPSAALEKALKGEK